MAKIESRRRSTHHLISQEQNSLEAEFSIAEIEKVLQRWTKEIYYHGIIVALLTIPTDKGNTNTTGQCLVNLCFILELRVLCLDRFELDGHFLPTDDVDAKVNITKGSRANLFANAVLERKFSSQCLFLHINKESPSQLTLSI